VALGQPRSEMQLRGSSMTTSLVFFQATDGFKNSTATACKTYVIFSHPITKCLKKKYLKSLCCQWRNWEEKHPYSSVSPHVRVGQSQDSNLGLFSRSPVLCLLQREKNHNISIFLVKKQNIAYQFYNPNLSLRC